MIIKQDILFKILFIILFILSCKEGKQVDTSKVFRYNEHKNINSLDPVYAKDIANIWAVNQIFNGLVEMDDQLNVVPSIAKKWEISDDSKKYIFTINTDIEFHPHPKLKNRKVTAYDFEYSFNRLINPEVAAPGAWVLEKVESFSAINDSIFEINLKKPFNAFLGILTMKYCSVVPKEIIELYGEDFRSNPVGTGPFMFKRWEENIKLVLRKNPNYFQKDEFGESLPYLEAVSITFLNEKQSEFLQLIKGKIDFISGLDNSYKDEILDFKGELKDDYNNSLKMMRGPFLNTEYLAFFMDSENIMTKSNLIRKAINIGFDKEKMIKFLRNGIGIPANGGFIPFGLPGYSEKNYNKYDVKKAKKYVDEFIKISGKSPSIKLTTSSNYLIFCEYIQKELEKIGIEIIIDVIPGSALKQAKANGKLNFFRASWIADYPDAENYLSLFYSKNFAPNGPNYTHFNDKNYDELYEKSLEENKKQNREILYKKMDSIIISKSIIVPLFYDEVIRFVSNDINGMKINATNLLDLRTVKKKN